MRKLYLDSADISDIKLIASTTAIAGVTTNPSLMAKTGKGSYHDKILGIAELLKSENNGEDGKHLSVEVTTSNPNEMVDQAIGIQSLLRGCLGYIDLHIKIPVTFDNLSIISELEHEHDIRVNATACMMPSQAKLASDAGASVVSFFYNRMLDGGDKTASYSIESFAKNREDASIICGSIRKPQDVYDCWRAGSDAVTCSLNIIKLLLKHPQTDLAVKQFQDDIDKWQE